MSPIAANDLVLRTVRTQPPKDSSEPQEARTGIDATAFPPRRSSRQVRRGLAVGCDWTVAVPGENPKDAGSKGPVEGTWDGCPVRGAADPVHRPDDCVGEEKDHADGRDASQRCWVSPPPPAAQRLGNEHDQRPSPRFRTSRPTSSWPGRRLATAYASAIDVAKRAVGIHRHGYPVPVSPGQSRTEPPPGGAVTKTLCETGTPHRSDVQFGDRGRRDPSSVEGQ